MASITNASATNSPEADIEQFIAITGIKITPKYNKHIFSSRF